MTLKTPSLKIKLLIIVGSIVTALLIYSAGRSPSVGTLNAWFVLQLTGLTLIIGAVSWLVLYLWSTRDRIRQTAFGGFIFVAALVGMGMTMASIQFTSFVPVCSGTNDTAAFSAILTTISTRPGSINIPWVSGSRCAVNNLTIPSNVALDFSQTAGIKVNTGQTLTIHGDIFGPTYQYFFNTGAGTVSLSGNTVVGVVKPEWWGAIDGATSTVTMSAFQAALDTGKKVFAGGPSYTLNNSTTPLMFNNNTMQTGTLVGAGQGNTLLDFTSTAKPGIRLEYLDGGTAFVSISDLTLHGAAGTSFVSGNYGIFLPGFDVVRHTISGLVIRDVTIYGFGDDGIRLQGPAGPINIINAHIFDCGAYGIKVAADATPEAPQNTSIYGGTIRRGCRGGISADGGTTVIQALLIQGVDIELGPSGVLPSLQTMPNIYIKEASGGVIVGGSTSSSVSSLSVGDSRIYFDTGAVRWNVSGVQNVAAGGSLPAFGGAYLPNNTIQEATSFPTRKAQIITGALSLQVDDQEDKNLIAAEADNATYLAWYLNNTNASGISRMALGMKPDETSGFLFQFDKSSKQTLFFNRATTGSFLFNTSTGNALTIANNLGATFAGTLAATGNLAVNTSKFTVAATSGNTVIAGTLGVTGNATVQGALNYAADAGSTDAYAVTLSPAPAAYTAGMYIAFTANTANTGACTINVNGLGAKALKRGVSTDPGDNYIKAGSVVVCIYDGTNCQIVTPAAQ